MPTTTIKVHPAIGIARLGNSPDEFFIGPETADEPPIPQNGYKDAQCRVKRQGARFRLFSYDQNGVVLDEITAAEATIVWKVELANRKASGLRFIGSTNRNSSITGADRDLLDIKPGLKTVNGPNQVVNVVAPFQVAGQTAMPVTLGQLRTDPEGRLVVLGGHGVSASPTTSNIGSWSDNDTWHDDVSDGFVKATVTLNATGEVFEAIAAWVIVAPPKFAPPIFNAITLYDTVYQFCRDLPAGHPAKVGLPPQCSFRRDIYRVLQSAKDVHAVANTGGAHGSFGPAQYPLGLALRGSIFGFLRGPGVSGTMPKLQQSPPLTQTQYEQLTRWKDGAAEFVDDWDPTLPATPITPDALDRGPLTHSVGAAFFPGIEAGAFLISASNIYLEPLRLDPAVVSPGDVTRRMALPWQGDFKACSSSGAPWWPANRPNDVHPQSDPSAYEPWDADIGSLTEMVTEWSEAGFVVRSGNDLVLTEKCGALSISLLTPELDFGDVQQNPLGQPGQMALPVAFEVLSPSSAITLGVATPPSDPAFATLGSTQVSVGPTNATTPVKAYLWIVFTTDTVDLVHSGSVVVEEVGTGRNWTVALTAKTVARQKTAVCLVLDRSGSMSDPSGSTTKIQAMQQAASLFINTALAEDGIGIVSYSSNATAHGSAVTELDALGSFAGPRDTLIGVVNGLTPGGGTSIGDGLEAAVGMLAGSAGFARKATVVLTDGVETASKYIADVAGTINSQTFGIGFGEPADVNVSTLTTLTGNHGGHLLITGAVTNDNQFLLKKYFLQVLAGVSNADIVLDPSGRVIPGQIHRVPFQLTEDDYGVDVILLCNPMRAVVMGLETPAGEFITLDDVDGVAVQALRTEQHTLLRIRLPVLFTERVAHGGRWHVLFGMFRRDLGRGPGIATGVNVAARGYEAAGNTRAGYVASTRAASPPGDKGALLALLTAPRAHPEAEARQQRLRSLAGLLAAEHRAAAGARVNFASNVHANPTTVQAAAAAELGPPYSVLVHVYSHLKLRAELLQSSFEPGAKIQIVARLSRVGMPFDGSATIFAEVTPPGGLSTTVQLAQQADGGWLGAFTAQQVGVHQVRVRALGRNIRNQAFTRELTLSAGIARGGNSYVPPRGSDDQGEPPRPDKKACATLLCMLDNGLFSKQLEAALARIGINLDVARKCLRKHCTSGIGGRELDSLFETLQGALRTNEASGAAEDP